MVSLSLSSPNFATAYLANKLYSLAPFFHNSFIRFIFYINQYFNFDFNASGFIILFFFSSLNEFGFFSGHSGKIRGSRRYSPKSRFVLDFPMSRFVLGVPWTRPMEVQPTCFIFEFMWILLFGWVIDEDVYIHVYEWTISQHLSYVLST
jgi:hypothetical protein